MKKLGKCYRTGFNPPSIGTTAPVISLALFEAKNCMRFTTSSEGSPQIEETRFSVFTSHD